MTRTRGRAVQVFESLDEKVRGMEAGPGGRQIQVEDPDRNPIELFEATR